MPERDNVLSTEYVYRGRVVTLRIDTIQLDDGRTAKREIVEHRGAVAIVPLLDDDTILMIRQYRQAVGETLLEIPAGTLEAGEEPAACAARELEEETGYRAGFLRPLFSQYLAPGYSSEVLHAFLGRDLTPTRQHTDADESIEVVPVRVKEAEALILNGGIRDAKTIAAILVATRLIDHEEMDSAARS